MEYFVKKYAGRGHSVWYKIDKDSKTFVDSKDLPKKLFEYEGIRTNNPLIFNNKFYKKIYEKVN